MPLYYFNIYNDDVTLDEEGAELADIHAAQAHAVTAARSLAAETVRHGHLTQADYIEIVDRDQNSMGKVRFGEAVDIRP